MKIHKLNRRKFLRNSSAGILGAGIFGIKDSKLANQNPDNETPKIKQYKTLGRTGFQVSDLGTGIVEHDAVLKMLLNSGVNLIETSEMYRGGNHEKLIGKVIQNFQRENLFIVSKISHVVKDYPTVEEVISRAEASLERLETNYLDCYMIHAAQSSDMVKNETFHTAVDKLQKAGKIRFRGVSCHGHMMADNPDETYEEVLQTAIEDGRFDVILLPYNILEREMGGRIIKAASERNVGTLGMKSNPFFLFEYIDNIKKEKEEKGKTLNEWYTTIWEDFKKQAELGKHFFEKYGYESMEDLKKGAIQFALSNQNMHSICYPFMTFEDAKKYIKLSGTTLDSQKETMLNDYIKMNGSLQCRIGCNICESSCPHQIPIGTIMRYSYYYHAKGRQKYAMQQYHALPGLKPDVCLKCDGFCENSCPYGVKTQGLLVIAHESLSYSSQNYT